MICSSRYRLPLPAMGSSVPSKLAEDWDLKLRQLPGAGQSAPDPLEATQISPSQRPGVLLVCNVMQRSATPRNVVQRRCQVCH